MKDIKNVELICPRCGKHILTFREVERVKEKPTEEDKREDKDSGQALSERPTTMTVEGCKGCRFVDPGAMETGTMPMCTFPGKILVLDKVCSGWKGADEWHSLNLGADE